MTQPYAAPPPGTDPVPRRLHRSSTDRYLAGVCGGVAEHLGVDVRAVRAVFVLLSVVGAGVGAYVFLWIFTPQDLAEANESPSRQLEGGPVGRAAGPRAALTRSQLTLLIGAGLLALGVWSGGPVKAFGLSSSVVLPVVAIITGAAIAWSQLDETERRQWAPGTKGSRILAVARPLAGVTVAIVGAIALTTQGLSPSGVLTTGLAAVAVLVGAGVIASPWVVRIWQNLQREQAERARATERADIAAHLHDSVLQTLALIQRTSADPQEAARLARSQERELRTWLYGGGPGTQADTLAAAVTAVAHEVEDLHGTPIELVVTGDRAMDADGAALVKAVREALLNAVRHGRAPVTAYLEVGGEAVEAYVRDHGDGFDVDAVPEDRLGVRESIVGRMSRHGGTARIRILDNGTEVALVLPTDRPAEPATPVEGSDE